MTSGKVVWAVATLLLAAPAVRGGASPDERKEAVGDPRRDLERLEGALESAVARVSRPSAAQVALRGSACVGYHLKGYGAVFILPPRALPLRATPRRPGDADAARALDQAARRVEEALERVDSEPLRLRIEESLRALRETQEEVRASQQRAREAAALAAEQQHLAEGRQQASREAQHAAQNDLEAQAEALQREAERAQQEVEQAMAEVERAVRRRVVRREGVAEAPAPAAPAAVAAPAQPPLPPWAFWFETEEADRRTPERVIGDVGSAVTEVLEAQGAGLRLLRPEEALAVAVDFFPQGGARPVAWSFGDHALSPRARPQRTLIVRARKKDLDDRQAGRIAPEELRRRIEVLEY